MKTIKTTITLLAFSFLTLVGCKDNANNQSIDQKSETNTKVVQEEFNVDGTEAKTEKSALDEQSNEATIIVKAKKALEYKFKVDQYEKLTYEWKADGALHYDFHGDPEAKNDYPQGYFESYAIGDSDHAKGMVTIPYKGSHGWYWKNESDKDISITLATKGKYNIIGILQ